MTNEQIIQKLKVFRDNGKVLLDPCLIDKDKLWKEMTEVFDMAIKILEAQEWVPVDEKSHPDTPERVQVQLDNGWIITAYYEENEWLSVPDCGEPIEDRWIEAWRPLPEPYREDGDGYEDR